MGSEDLNLTTGEAIQEFYNRFDFGEEGGVNEKYAWIKFGPISLPIPNTESRRRNVHLHDVNHILTENDTTWRGESAVSAWEVASGGWGRNYLLWFLTLWAMGLGVVFYPLSVLRSFRQGLTMNNAFISGLSQQELYQLSVRDLRRELSDKPRRNTNPYLWMFIAFATFLSPFVFWLAIAWSLVSMF